MTRENDFSNSSETTASTQQVSHQNHGYDAFYLDPTFWVGVSFTLVFVMLFKPLSKIIYSLLGKKIENIKDNIEEAKQLEIDAKKLLKEYEKRISNIDNEIKDILKKSKEEISFIKEKSIKDLDEELRRKKESNDYFIKNLQEQAQIEVKNLISHRVVEAIKSTITKDLGEKDQDQLINESIKNISKIK